MPVLFSQLLKLNEVMKRYGYRLAMYFKMSALQKASIFVHTGIMNDALSCFILRKPIRLASSEIPTT